ncbi:MAG: hypothetical protein ACH350_09415 [Parachlamydiaceae bacterium]
MHTVEKFYKKDVKNGGFSKSMKYPKKSNESIDLFCIKHAHRKETLSQHLLFVEQDVEQVLKAMFILRRSKIARC